MPTADEFLFGDKPTPKPTPNPVAAKAPTADEFLFGKRDEPPAQEPLSTTEKVLLTGARVVPPIVAGIVSAPLGPLAPLVTAGVGSAAEYGAERYEKSRGARKDISGGSVALAAPMSIIPGAKFEGVTSPLVRGALRVGEGAVIGGGSTTASTLVEEGRLPTADEFLFGAGTGAAFGAGGALLEHATGAGRARPQIEGETKPLIEGTSAETSVEGGPAPKEATSAPTPRPEPQPGKFEQPSFRKVSGLHEAAYGVPPMAARVRDPERLAGELTAVDRNHGHLPEESRDLLKGVIFSSADEIAHRARETQPVQRTMDIADTLVFDPETAAKKARGEVWNAEELHAAGSHIGGLLDEVTDLANQVQANPTDDALKLALQKKQRELVLSVHAYEGAKAETGRGLNILKYQQAALYKGDAGFIKQAMKYGASAEDIVNALRTAKTDQEKVRMLVALRGQKTSVWDYLRSYWMSNVLSGVKTQLRNAVGNSMAPVTDVVTTPLAAGVERLRGVAPGERTVFAGEVPYKFQALKDQEIGGMRFGFKEAMRQAVDVFQHGYERGGSAWELPPIEWTDVVAPNLSPTARRIIHAPTRALSAADTFFRTLNYHMDVFSGAFAQAKRELGTGASSEALQQRVTDILSRPDQNPQLFEGAAKYAQRRVYQESGKVDQWLLQGRDIGPMGFVIPFVRTPVALVRQGMQATPLGFSTKFHGTAPTARMSSQIRGEAAFGSMLMAGIGMGLAEGKIQVHGTGPSDPVERDKFYREGHRPNSVEIMGHDVGYSALGPLALPISLMANYFDAYNDARAKGDLKGAYAIAQKAAADGTGRAFGSLKDQSFVRGLSDLNAVLSDPEHYAARFFGGIASGFVPYSGAVRAVAQAEDPTLRKAETPGEVVRSGIPGAAEDVPPRIRATGEPIKIEQWGGALGRAVLPMDISTIHSSPVEKELDRLGVRLTMPRGEKVAKQKLEREDSSTLQQAKGQATMAGLEQVLAQPDYEKQPDTIKAKRLEKKIDQMRKIVQTRAMVARRAGRPLTVEDLMPPVARR